MRLNSITKFLMTAAALSLLTAINIFAQGARSTSSWETYQICDDSVSAVFPVAPTKQVRQTELGNGSILTLKMNTAGAGNSVFLVSCLEGLPFTAEEMMPDEQKVFFTGMMKNYAKLMGAIMETRGVAARVRMLPVRETVLGGRRGFEQDFTIGVSQGKAKMALYGTRGVWTIAMSVGGVIPARDKTAFFSSLEISENGS